MSIRWIKNVIIGDKKTTIEIQLGNRHIGDKCYTRIGNDIESYFYNKFDTRDEIIVQGLGILKDQLKDAKVTYPNKRDYDWK